MSARLFIRNDDVWTLDREFRFFFDLAMEHGLPVVHAVIPGKMDADLVHFLCRAKEKTPHLLDIVQHGWMHTNHGGSPKYEFGPSRSYEFQREDIRQGLAKMRAAFGEHFTSVFVPPYHGYDESTLQVLEEESFQIFSAGSRRIERPRPFLEIPALVSFSRYDQGHKIIHQAKDVLGLVTQDIERQPLSGVLTHHADFASTADRQELSAFVKYIAALETKKEWRVLSFSEILSSRRRV